MDNGVVDRARRFAAKEAAKKAANIGQWSQIMIWPARWPSDAVPQLSPGQKAMSGPVVAVLRGLEHATVERGSDKAAQLHLTGGQLASLSISHDGEYATAVCLAPTKEVLELDMHLPRTMPVAVQEEEAEERSQPRFYSGREQRRRPS